jgi:hypothetical protein
MLGRTAVRRCRSDMYRAGFGRRILSAAGGADEGCHEGRIHNRSLAGTRPCRWAPRTPRTNALRSTAFSNTQLMRLHYAGFTWAHESNLNGGPSQCRDCSRRPHPVSIFIRGTHFYLHSEAKLEMICVP